MNSIVGVSICILFATCFLMIPIILALRTIVIADNRGLTIDALFKTTFVSWGEISDYQKVRKLIVLGGFWRSYIKRSSDNKRIKIGFEYFEHIVLGIFKRRHPFEIRTRESSMRYSRFLLP